LNNYQQTIKILHPSLPWKISDLNELYLSLNDEAINAHILIPHYCEEIYYYENGSLYHSKTISEEEIEKYHRLEMKFRNFK